MPHINKFRSGMMKTKDSISHVERFKRGEHSVELSNGDVYESAGLVGPEKLKKGDIVLASYKSYNQGADLVEVLGFTDDDKKYGEGGVKFDSVQDLFKAKKVSSLKELEELQDKNEYGYHSNMVVKDLDDGDQGPWFYIFEGNWVRGSGAEKLTFTRAEKVTKLEESVDQLIKEAADHKEFSALWDKHVPDSGEAATAFGEAIRALGRIEYEAYNNGNCNVGDGNTYYTNLYKKLGTFLKKVGAPENVMTAYADVKPKCNLGISKSTARELHKHDMHQAYYAMTKKIIDRMEPNFKIVKDFLVDHGKLHEPKEVKESTSFKNFLVEARELEHKIISDIEQAIAKIFKDTEELGPELVKHGNRYHIQYITDHESLGDISFGAHSIYLDDAKKRIASGELHNNNSIQDFKKKVVEYVTNMHQDAISSREGIPGSPNS